MQARVWYISKACFFLLNSFSIISNLVMGVKQEANIVFFGLIEQQKVDSGQPLELGTSGILYLSNERSFC